MIPRCDECDRPAVLCDRDAFLCEVCDQRLNGAVEPGAAPGLRLPGAAGCGLRSKADPQPNGTVASFEAEVSALEAAWSRDENIIDILNSDGAIGLRGAR